MNIDFFKKLLSVPTVSRQEEQMTLFLTSHFALEYPEAHWHVDQFNNVYFIKGASATMPCVAAHIDSVQPIERKFTVEQLDGTLVAHTRKGKRCGFGADDKAGVMVCLEMLKRFDNIAAVFFAAEEIGCEGARFAEAKFFKNVGYLLEFDCPSRNMLSYSSSGERLFENRGEFISCAKPVLDAWGVTQWQRHPYSDVMVLRQRFDFSCLNLSCGYYNWHMPNEYVRITDTENSIGAAEALIKALGNKPYVFTKQQLVEDIHLPLAEVTNLAVTLE